MTRKERRDRDNAKRGEAGRKFWNTGSTDRQMQTMREENELDMERIRDHVKTRRAARDN